MEDADVGCIIVGCAFEGGGCSVVVLRWRRHFVYRLPMADEFDMSDFHCAFVRLVE